MQQADASAGRPKAAGRRHFFASPIGGAMFPKFNPHINPHIKSPYSSPIYGHIRVSPVSHYVPHFSLRLNPGFA